MWGYDYIDGKLVINEREADMVRRVFRFANRLIKYNIDLDDQAFLVMNAYWERLKVRAGLENVNKPWPEFWNQKKVKEESDPIISADMFKKVQEKLKKRSVIESTENT
jgi:hypothetical protein